MTAEPSGTPVSLDALLAHRDWVRALARSLVRDEHRADDVEQEAWRMALERPPRHAGSLRAWFATVVRNAARGAGRRTASRARFEAMAASPTDAPTPADVVAEAEVQHRLVDAVLALDEPYRTAILLRYFHGLSATEIASRAGESVETVRTRIKRGVERLRRVMELELGADRDAWFLLVAGHRSPTGGAATGTGAAPLVAAGGLAMGAATKLAAGTVAVVVLGALVWTIARPRDAERPTASLPVADDAHLAARSSRARPGEATSEPQSAPAPDADGVVDITAADRDLDLAGFVVGDDGAPVAGARLVAVGYPWRQFMLLNWDGYFAGRDGPETKTGKDGSFVLRLARGRQVALRVRAAGFADVTFESLQAGERARLVLPRAVRVLVHAKDDAGRPVVDADVLARNYGRPDGLAQDVRTRTAADGDAAVEGLPAGRKVSIEVVRAGVAKFRTILDLPRDGAREVVAVLVAGETVTGRVTDATTGRPIAGARVASDWSRERAVTTDADGRYALAGHLAADGDVLHATADGFARCLRPIEPGKDNDIALSPGGAIVGRVVDVRGTPVVGALVSAIAHTGRRADTKMSVANGTSGEDGRFRLADVRRDLAHGLFVLAEGHGRRALDVPASAVDAVREVGDVVLGDPRTIEVRLVGMDGGPLARHRVDLWAEKLEPSGDYGAREVRFTDDLGRARFPDLGPGAFRVIVDEPPGNTVTRTLVVGDADPEPVTISFEADRTYRVRVTDDAGAPLAGFRVQLEFDGAPPQGKDAGDDGVAEFASRGDVERILLFGRTEAARAEFVTPKPPPIARNQTEWTVVVHRAMHISGRVLDPSGNPLANAMVNARRGLALAGYATSGKDGTFRMAVASGDDVDLVLQQVHPPRDDLPEITGEVRRVAPGTSDVVMATRACTHDRSLRVRVEDPDGNPVAGALVMALGSGAEKYNQATTDETGVAAFEKLADAQTFLHVDMAARGSYEWTTKWARPRGLSVFPEGQVVTMRLLAAVHLRGKVLGADGKPAAGAYVDALTEGFAANGKSSATGEFDLLVPADEKGEFQIMARLYEGRREVGSANRYGLRPDDGEIVVRLVAR